MIVFSVLDRLLKDPPFAELDVSVSPYRQSRDWMERQMEPAIRAFRQTVQENLEWLLNTRRVPPPPKVAMAGIKPSFPPREQDERAPVETSVFYYGLPSFAHVTLSPGAQEADVSLLAAEIEGTIRVFEPRILDPKVTMEQMPSLHRELRFRVTGKLKIEPDPQFVQYRTKLDIDSGRYEVELSGERDA